MFKCEDLSYLSENNQRGFGNFCSTIFSGTSTSATTSETHVLPAATMIVFFLGGGGCQTFNCRGITQDFPV